jgi:hypothetical protein
MNRMMKGHPMVQSFVHAAQGGGSRSCSSLVGFTSSVFLVDSNRDRYNLVRGVSKMVGTFRQGQHFYESTAMPCVSNGRYQPLQQRYRNPRVISPASLFYYNQRQQRWMSNDDKKKEEPYKYLPFWTTPERNPHDSMYIQDPIAEADCRPLRLYIPTELDMEEIGTFVAMMIMTTPDDNYDVIPNKGDVIFLKGDLGAGKSVFARGFVRAAVGNWKLDVPSPTYLLSNTYFASEEKQSNQNLE